MKRSAFIQAHPILKKIKCETHKTELTVIDSENARIIWQGQLNYGGQNNKITAVTQIDNQKYYDTKLKFDNKEDTVWLETTDR